jgi:hypothetical protein
MNRSKVLGSLFVGVVVSTLAFVGCSKPNSTDSASGAASAVSISGALAVSGSSSANIIQPMSYDKFAVSDYKIACVTFELIPNPCSGDVAADGAFNLSCSGYAGVPFGCFVYHKTSYANYPITFNIDSGGDQKSVAISGAMTATVNLDLETGTAAAAAAVTSGTETEVAVDTSALANIDGTYAMGGAPWAEVEGKFSLEQLEFFKTVPCFFGNQNGPPDFNTCRGTAQAGYEAMAQKMSGGAVQLVSGSDADGAFMSAWQAGARAACGNVESGFTFKIGDGNSGNAQADVTFDLSGTTQSGLKTAMGTSIGTVLTNWFPFLVDGGGSSSASFTATCKYAIDLGPDFFNNTPEQVSACQSSSSCFDGRGDAMGALHRYKFAKLYAQFSGTDPILGAVNFSANTVAENATKKYGYRTWSNGAESIAEIAGLTDSNIDDYRVDVGGCIQWPDWSSATPGQQMLATIVPVGDYVSYFGPNGQKTTNKCTFSEKRLLYQDNANGYIQIGANKYKDINVFVQSGSAFKETWNKVCSIEVDQDGNSGTTGDIRTEVMTYPVDFDSTKIASEMGNRENGGSPEQKKGMAMDAVYQLLTSDEGWNENRTFEFWNGTGKGSVTCTEIKTKVTGEANQEAVWDKVGKAFESVHDPRTKAQLLNCALIAVASDNFDAVDQDDDTNVDNPKADFPAGVEYRDMNSNGLSDIVETLKANSCIPKFQFASICSDDGFCSNRVVCNSMTEDNGGCDKADPAGRHAKMKAEGLGSNRFVFSNIDTRYESFFDPSSGKSKQCTRTEGMAMTTVDAVSALSAGQSMRMTMERVESKVCDGETSEVMAFPPIYLDFTKQ